MLISLRHKFVYVGINKTASTSIHSMFKPYSSRIVQRLYKTRHIYRTQNKPAFKHLPALQARNLIGEDRWNSYFTFTFVRNPWVRVFSEYVGHRHDDQVSVVDGFKAWVKAGGNWLARENSMRNFVCDEQGNQIVNFVGRVENLEADLCHITERLSMPPLEVVHRNKSRNTAKFADIFDDEVRQIVLKWIEEDLEFFDYPKSPF